MSETNNQKFAVDIMEGQVVLTAHGADEQPVGMVFSKESALSIAEKLKQAASEL